MKDWFTIKQIDKNIYIIRQYRHWKESYVQTCNRCCNHLYWDHIGGHKYSYFSIWL